MGKIGLEISLVGINRKEVDLTFARIEKMTAVVRPGLWFNQGSLSALRSRGYRGGGGPVGLVIGIKRATDGRMKCRLIADEKRKKRSPKNRSLRNTLANSKFDYCDFEKPSKGACQKAKVMKSTEQSKERDQLNKLAKESGMVDGAEKSR